jgi:hypothetical protein
MASERGIGDAVDQARVLADEIFEGVILTAVLTVVLTARYRHGLAQDCLSRQQTLDLSHEDRRDVGFVQVFLEERTLGRRLLAKSLNADTAVRF